MAPEVTKNGVPLPSRRADRHQHLEPTGVGDALDIPMSRELMELAIRWEGDAAIRCVIMTGAGRREP